MEIMEILGYFGNLRLRQHGVLKADYAFQRFGLKSWGTMFNLFIFKGVRSHTVVIFIDYS